MKHTLHYATRLLLLALLTSAGMSALAAPPHQSRLVRHWSAHDNNSSATIDHSAFADFLDKYLVVRDDAPNLIRYQKVSQADHKRLVGYIQRLATIPLAQYNRKVQLAYWLNLYNAALLNLILDHYPVDSIRKINWGQAGIWEIPAVQVDGYRLSLATIRYDILQPIWHQSLVYYGLSSAALGGPGLPAQPYSANGIEQQLRANARKFINSDQGLRINDDKLIVSSFFERYRNAFGRSDTALISQLREHAAPALSARLDVFNTISEFTYDWHLNAAS